MIDGRGEIRRKGRERGGKRESRKGGKNEKSSVMEWKVWIRCRK